MAKYIINRGSNSQRTVEAEEYRLADGFFWFTDDKGEDVLTYKADHTTSITREDSAK